MQERKIKGIGYVTGSWPLVQHQATIVFIHGVGGSSSFWHYQINNLPRVNTLAIDLPGHGRSDGQGLNSIEEYASAVIDFIYAIKVPNPIPCGLSMGGAIALQLLLDYSESLEAGILLNTGARLKVAPVIFETLENNYDDYLEMMGRIVSAKNTDIELVKRFKEETARCRPEVIRRDFQACNDFDVMQRLGSISLPVLVVSAEEDQMTPPKYAEYLIKHIPTAVGAHITNAGHILPIENPGSFNRTITEFISQNNL